jgi:hypothetical protein
MILSRFFSRLSSDAFVLQSCHQCNTPPRWLHVSAAHCPSIDCWSRLRECHYPSMNITLCSPLSFIGMCSNHGECLPVAANDPSGSIAYIYQCVCDADWGALGDWSDRSGLDCNIYYPFVTGANISSLIFAILSTISAMLTSNRLREPRNDGGHTNSKLGTFLKCCGIKRTRAFPRFSDPPQRATMTAFVYGVLLMAMYGIRVNDPTQVTANNKSVAILGTVNTTIFWTFVVQCLFVLIQSVVVPLRIAGGEDGGKRATAMIQRMRRYLILPPMAGFLGALPAGLGPWIRDTKIEDGGIIAWEISVVIAATTSCVTCQVFGRRLIAIIDSCIELKAAMSAPLPPPQPVHNTNASNGNLTTAGLSGITTPSFTTHTLGGGGSGAVVVPVKPVKKDARLLAARARILFVVWIWSALGATVVPPVIAGAVW